MAQAGIHGLLAQAIRKWIPRAEWLMLGIVFGSVFPDTDNLLVAIATVMKRSTVGLHRTFTHSLLVAAAIALAFLVVGALTKQKRWSNLGLGLAIGIALHSLVDLLIWFNGVALLWPLQPWINLWTNVTPPAWIDTLMNPLEFLFLATFLYLLYRLAKRSKTDPGSLKMLQGWMIALLVLFAIFTPLLYTPFKLAFTLYGLFYLVALIAALVIVVRMRRTIESY